MPVIEKTEKAPEAPSPVPGKATRAPSFFRGGQTSHLPWILLTIGVAVLVLLPLIPLQGLAWGNGADGMRRLLDMYKLGEILQTTLILGFGGLAVGLVMGTVLALCTYSMTPKSRSFFEFLPVLPMVIPAVAHVVGFVFLFSPENGYVNTLLRNLPLFSGDSGPINVYTLPWIVFYTGTHLAAFVYLFVYTGLRNLGSDYALAARVNGASGFRALITVTIPLLRPTFVYAGVVVLLLSLGQFTGPLILGRREGIDVVTTQMYEISAEYPVDYSLAAALGTPLILLAVLLIIIQRKMVGNHNRFIGQGASTIDNRMLNPVVSLCCSFVVGMYVLIAAVLPLLAITFVSFSPFWSGSFDTSGFTIANFRETLADQRVLDSIVTTLYVSIVGVLLVLPVGMLISLGIYNRDKLWRPLPAILDILANLPLTVPAALLGFGFLFAFSSQAIGIYGTQLSLILAYMTIMIPYSVRYQLATLVSLGRHTMEASQVSGAHPVRTFFQIILPMSKTGIISSVSVMFVLLTHEFGVSLLLRAPDASVMSVVLYDQYSGGSYPKVAVIALIMTVMTGVGVALAMIFGGKKALEKF
ncbi:ABC transporter permease [Rhodococcus opacus]|uniref:ABC transporter permease n=1 Tax=Rhodococcus opacus TaxID=37919 RepID=UPI002954CD3E|nr:ABC transporter permease subunit [Rhodococcus opacus]MDV7090803.1 ABC transporter permease subunit [Rhodococcus opacus]